MTLRTYTELHGPPSSKAQMFYLIIYKIGQLHSSLVIMYKIQYIHLFPTINFDMFDRKHKMDMKY